MISKIYKLGLHKNDDALTTLRTTITNLIILCTTPFVISYFPVFYKYKQFNILLFNCFALSLLIYSLYLNYKGKKKLATKIVYSSSCFLILIPIITYGRGTELQSIAPILMIFVFILFDKFYNQIFFSVINILTLLFGFIYIEINGPLIQQAPFKYDYFVNMGFALFSCGLLSYTVMRTLKNYINHREQAYKQLAEKNEVIKKQNEELELFTSMASHDLKTPTRTITSFLGLLEKTSEIKDTNSQQYLKLAMSGAKQLNNLVEGLSTFKNIEQKYKPENYSNSNEILASVLLAMDIENREDVVITHSSLPDLKIVSTQLYHVFQNLIGNAIKYNNNKEKKIKIDSKITASSIRLTVTDNGIGIDKRYHDYIFEPFKKLHASDKYESTGLGLAICKKILDAYNATLSFESNSKEGTTFIINIPIGLLNT